jgi:hypothetical protein
MSEDIWLSSHDPVAMLNFLNADPADRKPLLVVLAYIERIWDITVPCPIREWADQAKLIVDGHGDRAAFEASEVQACHYLAGWNPYYLREGISPAATVALNALFFFAQAEGDDWEPVGQSSAAALLEYAVQADLVREVFGNPLRPVAFEPIWLSPEVDALARRIDSEQRFDLMPALGNALEVANCTETTVLDHCRRPGGHVSGCWVVDSLLGRGCGERPS